MDVNTEKLKENIINSLKTVNAIKIILFGSYAYGTPTYDSDLDICVVEETITSKTDEKKKIRDLLKSIKIPKDIIVTPYDEYEFYKNEINSVFYDIDKKGIILWQNNNF